MIRAFLAGSIIAVLASSLGLFVVVRRYSMLSDSLAHISLLGVALGFLFSVSTTWAYRHIRIRLLGYREVLN